MPLVHIGMQESLVTDIPDRKADHLRLADAGAADAAETAGAGFDDVHLVHDALPELDLDAIDTRAMFLGRSLSLPLMIASMTGGHALGGTVNAVLARGAERHGLAMGVGSQRAALRDRTLRDTYAVARREAPTALLLANVGAAQLVRQGDVPPLSPKDVTALAEMIRADAVIVHLNALQELIQPEGDRNAVGWTDAIGELAVRLPVRVVVKETGGGVSEAVARRLAATGVAALDVGGAGGTSFALIEGRRAAERGDTRRAELGDAFGQWGIPTAVSVVLAVRSNLPVVATGGIRSGLDGARALALGASVAGVARPLLTAAMRDGDAGVDRWIERYADGLRGAMFLTGSPSIEAARRAAVVLTGATRAWLDAMPAVVDRFPPAT
jgi:isopentenyl-diphosphate delta-isomerase